MMNGVPEMSSRLIDGVEIKYLVYGEEGPDVVLAHATGFNPYMFHPISKALSKKYRVIVPCLCSHRDPGETNSEIGWETLAGDLYSLLKSLGVEQPFLVGHSMGAVIVTLIHCLFKLPARKMVLIEPIFLPHETYGMILSVTEHPMASKAIKRKNGWQNIDACRAYFLSKPFFQSWDKEMLELYLSYGLMPEEDGGVSLACPPEKEAGLFLGSTQRNPWPLLKEAACPVLLLEGEISENRIFLDLKETTKAFRQGSYREITGAGHLIPMEKPAETLEVIETFFQADGLSDTL